MNDSMNRLFVCSSCTVSGGTRSSPGNTYSGDRSRSAAYIGCGNVGASMIGSSSSPVAPPGFPSGCRS